MKNRQRKRYKKRKKQQRKECKTKATTESTEVEKLSTEQITKLIKSLYIRREERLDSDDEEKCVRQEKRLS
ncbi:MAG: hypothetical protein ACLTEE_11350 [Anaerobutyricum hallii]